MNKICICSLALWLTACSAVSVQEREAREYRAADWKLRYLAYASTCSRAGGRMIVHRFGQARTASIPRPTDRFHCTASIGKPPTD